MRSLLLSLLVASAGLFGQATQVPAATPNAVILGTSKVVTQQSTSSTTYVDLTTADTITFTLTGTSKVLVQYSASVTINTTFTCLDTVNIDGSNISDGGGGGGTSTDWGVQSVSSGFYTNSSWQYITSSLGAGPHTIKIQHRAAGNSCSWQNRTLVLWTTP